MLTIYLPALYADRSPDGMLNSTTWLYGAEVLPIALRSKVMGLAAASHFIVNVGSKSPPPSCVRRFWLF